MLPSLTALYTLLGFLVAMPAYAMDAHIGSELRPHDSGRYLVDSQGMPVYLATDTAWALAWSLTRPQVDQYLDDRKQKGFSAVAFLGYPYEHSAGIDQANRYGHKATDNAGDPAITPGASAQRPNDYWDHVDYIIDALAARGMYALLLPTWGSNWVGRSDCEWLNKSCFLTVSQMRSIGETLGARYRDGRNIVWVLGGDTPPVYGGPREAVGYWAKTKRILKRLLGRETAPPPPVEDKRAHYHAMAEGILRGVTGVSTRYDSGDPAWDRVLMTYHGADWTATAIQARYSSSSWWHDESWYDIDFIYTGHPSATGEWPHPRSYIYELAQAEYRRSNPKPVMDSEPTYEGFNRSGKYEVPSRHFLQGSTIGGFFAGAMAGYVYGHHNIFTLDGFPEDLDAVGARDYGRFVKFLTQGTGGWSGAWFDLRPDVSIVASNVGGTDIDERKQGMRNIARPELLVFFPVNSESGISLAQLSGQVSGTWWNPSDGSTVSAGTYQAGRTVSFEPPGGWISAILILRSANHARAKSAGGDSGSSGPVGRP